MMRTLFLQAPACAGFDGGAGARYQARREIRSFWYPTWLAQTAALVPGSKLIDAPAHALDLATILRDARAYDLAVLHTSTPSFSADVRALEALKAANPGMKVGFVGAKVAVEPKASLEASPSIDFVTGSEFDFTIKELAEGRDWDGINGLFYRDRDGRIRSNPSREILQDMDLLPFVTPVYKRDLTIENYFIGYLQHPYLSLYTGRGWAPETISMAQRSETCFTRRSSRSWDSPAAPSNGWRSSAASLTANAAHSAASRRSGSRTAPPICLCDFRSNSRQTFRRAPSISATSPRRTHRSSC